MEQYPTSPELAAAVALTALQHGDLGPDCTALDLGTGTGMLACAAALVETNHVLGVDCDATALAVAKSNAELADVLQQVDFLQARVKDLTAAQVAAATNAGAGAGGGWGGKGGRGRGGGRGKGGRARGGRGGRGGSASSSRSSTTEARQLILSDDDGLPLLSNCADTVLTNPPFGTKANAGMDLRFLRTATRLSRRAVYSFHKTSTRDFLIRQVESWGMEIRVVAEMRFDLPQTYKFHKNKSVDVQVDLIRVLVNKDDEAVAKPPAPLLDGECGPEPAESDAESVDDNDQEDDEA